MLLAAAFISLVSLQAPIQRDAYGVPHIKADTVEQAFFHAGYAVAEDRLWQMENSRRLARGKMAEVFGSQFVAADQAMLSTSYTDAELRQQYEGLSAPARQVMDSYVSGVNAYIAAAKEAGKLPAGYAQNGFEPAPWTVEDSVAVAIQLFQQFGRGGAGEIRNMALNAYLNARPNLKDKTLDVLDDLAWHNDPAASTTILAAEDPLARNHPAFPNPTRAQTQAHLASLPNVGLFELLPGIRMVLHEESNTVAETIGAPFKAGSYAVVVGGGRSANGKPILLSAPQMGFTTPSIVHEMSIETPQFKVVGLDVPGVPGVAIGHTEDLAWGLTSGVADTDDIFFFPMVDADTYTYGTESRDIEAITRELKVKGEEARQVVQRRTMYGPVVISSTNGKAFFARRSSYWMKELGSMEAFLDLYTADTPAEVEGALKHATMSFNMFYALQSGDIGYRYVGMIPVRAQGLDPRFPTPASPANDWKGFVPFEQMPHVANPRSGLITNWNNKPVAWWSNFDTPVWGKLFRNSVLNTMLSQPKVSTADVEMAAWWIARMEYTYPYFKPYLDQALEGRRGDVADALRAFDGRQFEGSIGATLYARWFNALREEIFMDDTGNFLTPDTFALAIQPTVMLNALQGATKFNYLPEGGAAAVAKSALDRVENSIRDQTITALRYVPGGIRVPDQPPIPYSNRGTYIQIVEMLAEGLSGRNVLPPGVAESGPHAFDQVPLARAWTYKPMKFAP